MRNDRECVNPYPKEFGTEIKSSILTAPYDSDRAIYDIRKAAQEADVLGRPLTEEELEKFIIKK